MDDITIRRLTIMKASMHCRFLARKFAAFAAGVVGSLALATAHAAYPEKPVRILVGFAAGGTTDVVARLLSKELTEALGQPFVVENKPGAGSNLATAEVARAAPDGYTLLMMAVTSTINETLYSNLNYNLLKDFTGIALAAKVPNLLVVTPSLPVKSVQELVAYAKANPGKLAFASSGSGTSIHMAGELFKLKAGVDMMHVPYKGSAPAITDLIGGQVQLMFDNMPSAWPHAQSGKLRALAVTTTQRSASAPAVPTLAESGFPGFDVSSWFGLVAPAGTPPEIINKLNAVVQKAIQNPDMLKRYADLGAQAQATTPQQFTDFIKLEVETWRPVVKASGAKGD
jgi:tripartite-type tricarboxylate transporter receptor subunit TctC